ncbi:uncharacterized protein BBA_09791 [Beauveria bassiana ARSEF 2860]|uniref:Uncharacterized protein n=1 Tax=Beauveria bassiana (strain ARSEF 2860) TaxID=655819 RepID=J4VRM3_BEAB2|nr:uncharacterized protein BBA_09791 [Beauveria bassiana ARSEF 2860]EJP61255.1 hypothetical protein BBA_09791 [Beauveria bassiana ARSEF 2860]
MDKRGYVSTVAADGRPLIIYYIHEDKKRVNAIRSEVRVLQEFAAAWTKGELDVNGKPPFQDAQTCDRIVVTGGDHVSTNTPQEARHLTISPASEASWAAGWARSGIHVYSIDNQLAMGYRGWRRASNSRNRFQGGMIKQHLQEAMSNALVITEEAGEQEKP